MRKVRGYKAVIEYLTLINCPMSMSTVQRLVRTNEIPHSRPAPRVLIFNLDKIDQWLEI